MQDDRLPTARDPAGAPYRWGVVAAGVLAVLLPALVARSEYFVYLGTMALVLSLLAQSWGLLAQVGLISFGHAAFFGLGAYGSALLSLRWHFSPWIALLAAALLTAAFGLIAAATVGDLTGPYFSLATLALAEVLRVVALHWTDLTEGAWGLVGVPGLPPVRIPGLEALSGAVGARVTNYYVALIMLVGISGLYAWMRRAPLGLAFEAIRQGEERAAALGVDTRRAKRIALAVSGLFAGGAGALHAHIFHWVDPT
ncbi:MAG TPA: branched-chain amino acid ABC transporter permease, partial [Candidatus Methylomirabilis sp.]